MNYTLNQLRIFLKITQTQSVTKAADELFLTQPAVSIQLKNFQSQFEIPLTEVVGRKIFITDFGQEIAESAREIIELVNSIDNKTQRFKGRLTGRIVISVVSTGKYVMPFFIAEFARLHPEVEIMIDVTNKNQVIESLENNQVDFSLVSIVTDKMNVEKLDLLKNRLYLVGKAEEMSMNKKKKVDLNQLTLIFREEGSGTRISMEKFIQNKELKVTKKLELASNEAVKQAILAGMGYSIMPLIGIKNELLNGELEIVPIKGLPIETNWSLVWAKGKKHSPAVAQFMEYIQKEKDKIIHEKFKWYEKYLQ